MGSVPASETTRKRIETMISGVNSEFRKNELVCDAVRLIVEEALEGEGVDRVFRPRRRLRCEGDFDFSFRGRQCATTIPPC